MSGAVGAGCRIMRCEYLQNDVCTYLRDRCRYNDRPYATEPHVTTADLELRLKLAADALGAVSDAYGYTPLNEEDAGAEEMRDIADSALRRLSLNSPDS